MNKTIQYHLDQINTNIADGASYCFLKNNQNIELYQMEIDHQLLQKVKEKMELSKEGKASIWYQICCSLQKEADLFARTLTMHQLANTVPTGKMERYWRSEIRKTISKFQPKAMDIIMVKNPLYRSRWWEILHYQYATGIHKQPYFWAPDVFIGVLETLQNKNEVEKIFTEMANLESYRKQKQRESTSKQLIFKPCPIMTKRI